MITCESCVVYPGIEEEQLREVFKDCGEIESVRLIRDNKTGIGKGFGFVLFKVRYYWYYICFLSQ